MERKKCLIIDDSPQVAFIKMIAAGVAGKRACDIHQCPIHEEPKGGYDKTFNSIGESVSQELKELANQPCETNMSKVEAFAHEIAAFKLMIRYNFLSANVYFNSDEKKVFPWLKVSYDIFYRDWLLIMTTVLFPNTDEELANGFMEGLKKIVNE